LTAIARAYSLRCRATRSGAPFHVILCVRSAKCPFSAAGKLPLLDSPVPVTDFKSGMKTIWRVFAYLKRYPWLAAGTLSCAVLGTLMVIIFPAVTKRIIDDVVR